MKLYTRIDMQTIHTGHTVFSLFEYNRSLTTFFLLVEAVML